MQRMFKTAQKLSDLSCTVPFTKSKQLELFKYTSGRWLYNEEERECVSFVPWLFWIRCVRNRIALCRIQRQRDTTRGLRGSRSSAVRRVQETGWRYASRVLCIYRMWHVLQDLTIRFLLLTLITEWKQSHAFRPPLLESLSSPRLVRLPPWSSCGKFLVYGHRAFSHGALILQQILSAPSILRVSNLLGSRFFMCGFCQKMAPLHPMLSNRGTSKSLPWDIGFVVDL